MTTTSVTSNFLATLQKLGIGDAWEQKGGSWWIFTDSANVRNTAQVMVAHDARLATVSSFENETGEILLDYHWSLYGTLVTIETLTKNKQVNTITDIFPGADWVEREIHDYWLVEFPDRVDTKRLVTREGTPQGMFCNVAAEGGAK
jgi:Ni,Fe-hydrogenase III component G